MNRFERMAPACRRITEVAQWFYCAFGLLYWTVLVLYFAGVTLFGLVMLFIDPWAGLLYMIPLVFIGSLMSLLAPEPPQR